MKRFGFTFIEIIVAIFILTTTIAGVFLIYRNSASSFMKVREQNLISQASLIFIGNIQATNLFVESRGAGDFGEVHYSWRVGEVNSSPVTIFKLAKKTGGGIKSIFTVGLFSINAVFECGDSSRKISLKELSWRKNEE